jgi:hypothetical protein
MQTPATEIDQRIVQLNEFIFPSLPTWRLSRRIRQDLLLAASMMHSSRGFWTWPGYLRLEQRSPEWGCKFAPVLFVTKGDHWVDG